MADASADWTANRDYVAPALAFRVPGGGMIWLFVISTTASCMYQRLRGCSAFMR